MSVTFKHGKLSILGLLIVGMMLGGLFFSSLDFGTAPYDATFVPSVNADARTLKQISDTFASVAEKVTPSVVLIRSQGTTASGEQRRTDPFFEDFFGPFTPRQPERPQRGLGSGVVVSQDGYILTNNHVVDGADKITVTLPDKREFNAKIVGTDPNTDLAVIKIEGKDFPVLTFGNSDELRVGEWVIAVGNPAGLTHTVTAGIVSAKGRGGILDQQTSYEDFIQTDAAINPGNSGGALVDLDGNLMGINTAIVGRGYQGLGFAIPSNMARDVMTSLIRDGRIIRGYLGIFIQDLNEEMADAIGLENDNGVIVSNISRGGPASNSDLEQGDIIIALNGEGFQDNDEFRKRVARIRPGTNVELGVVRDGKRMNVTVELGELPATAELAADQNDNPNMESRLGLTVQDLTRDVARRLGYQMNEGVIISEIQPGSVAENAGLQRGDLIKQINSQPITSLQVFVKVMNAFKPGHAVMMLIQNQRGEFFIGLRVPRE